MKEIIIEIEEIETISINGKNFKIEKFIGGDLKFLALIYGINAANSNQPCIWCSWNKNKNIECQPRTLIEARQNTGSNGFKSNPLLSKIDFNHCIIDMLHLFLRISDKLFDLLYAKLIEKDGNADGNLDKRPNFNKVNIFV